MLIVFDIDSVLANIEHRAIHLEKDAPDWKAFLDPKNIAKDVPNNNIIAIYKTLLADSNNRVEIWTGRCESTMLITHKWLQKYAKKPARIRMRPKGSFATNADLKRMFIKQYGKPDLVFDGQLETAQMWQRRNIDLMYVTHSDINEE